MSVKNYRLQLFGLTILAGLVMSSCSEFNEVAKSDDIQRKFEMANALFEEGQTPRLNRKGEPKMNRFKEPKLNTNSLLRSVTLYEDVYTRIPKTGEGELSYFRLGKAYYLAGDYYTGGYYLGMFPQRFPYSVKAEEALFLSAMCSVNNSPEYSLDQTETELAINDLQQFIDRYPNSMLIDSCNRIIDKLRFKLERKDYESVKLYAKTERFNAAVTSGLIFMKDFPMSEFVEEVNYLVVKNSYLLAKNSIETKKKERIENTIERYSTFVSTFPESEYISTLQGYKSLMDEELNQIIAEEEELKKKKENK